MTPMPADIRAVSYEDLEKLVAFYERRRQNHENLSRLYNELDRRDGLLDDNYQLITPEEA
jgi:hypothetical protein